MMVSSPKTAPNASLRTALIVLGMHRSGTSLLTRLLSLMGADLPATLIGPSPHNPTGYWESPNLRNFNDRLLAFTGSRWDDWRALPDGWELSPKVGEFVEEAMGVLDREFDNSRFLVLKDPRVARIMPFWDLVFKMAGITTRPIFALRNPLEVAASLNQRNGFAPEMSYLIWLRHMIEAEWATRGRARVVVSYDDVMQNWAGAMGRVAKVIDVAWPRGPAQISTEVAALISPEHRNHVSDVAQLDSPLVSDWLRDTYAIFDHWATKEEREADHARLDVIRADLNSAAPAFAPIIEEMRFTATELNKRLNVIEDNKARIADLADARRALQRALDVAKKTAKNELADAQRAAREELTAAKAAADTSLSKMEKTLVELERERQLRRESKAQFEASIEAQSRLANMQARVIQKLQREIEIEVARADSLQRNVSIRLRARVKALRRQLNANAAEIEAARVVLENREATLIVLQEESAKKDADLAALQEDLTAADDTVRIRTDQLAETRSALAQKNAELTDNRLELEKTEAWRKDSDRHALNLSRINTDLRREVDLHHTHILSLMRENKMLQTTAANAEAVITKERAAHDAELSALKIQLTHATARTETCHSELAQITKLLMQTETKAAEALAKQRAATVDITAIVTLLQPSRHTWLRRRGIGRLRREMALVRRSGLFDADWYLSVNPDVAESGMDALKHFLLYGLSEGRAPREPKHSLTKDTPAEIHALSTDDTGGSQ